VKGCVKCDIEIRVLDHTSKEDNWQRREEQVIQQNKRVLVQVGGVETYCVELVLAIKDTADTHLLNGKYQNMANTQITFYQTHQYI
jgi:hypothetical protein